MSASTPSYPLSRSYSLSFPLKYGLNPHQSPSAALSLPDCEFPIKVLNGAPGYINLLDALNGFQLARELHQSTGLPAAASFKHCSPAGAAIARPLDSLLSSIYEVDQSSLSPSAIAYIRARQADPKSSFGDFASLSAPVDLITAKFLSQQVSDGIIAPSFDSDALELLKQKKGGNYVILQCPIDFKPPPFEYRELFGVCLVQKRNDGNLSSELIKQRIVGENKEIPENKIQDILVAAITSKYTQSNSVVYAVDGQVIGVSAGQQSRVDSVKLAGVKAEEWYLRQHERIRNISFKSSVKRAERTNIRIGVIQGDWSETEREFLHSLMEEPVEPLTTQERKEFLKGLKGVSMSSDGFFPFRDSIDQAAKRGVQFIIQPGGSVSDETVRQAAKQYGMIMCESNIRLFHH
jgi:phosphoribosylaminoimidazolecarboxamide formyltransferase/IMP cyclohydrolase